MEGTRWRQAGVEMRKMTEFRFLFSALCLFPWLFVWFQACAGRRHRALCKCLCNKYNFILSLPSATLTHSPKRVKAISYSCDLAISAWLYVPMLHAVWMSGTLVLRLQPWEQWRRKCQYCLNMSLHIGLLGQEGHLFPERHNNLCQLVKLAYCWFRHWTLTEHFVPAL